MHAKVSLLEHTADLGLEAVAATPAATVEALGMALTRLVAAGVDLGPVRSVEVCAGGLDAVEALVAWLNELLFAQQSEALLITAISLEQCTATRICAKISGVDFDPRLHRRRYEIKAVTYHQARFAPTPDGWSARVYLDL